MAITSADYIRVVGPEIGGHTPIYTGVRNTSVAVKRGDPLALASGKCAIGSASGVVKSTVVGVAADPETASSGTAVTYVPAIPGVKFRGKIYSSTASSAKVLQKWYGAKVGLKKYTSSSANVYVVNVDESSANNQCVVIRRFIDALSTTNGWVEFTFVTGTALS